MVEHIYKSTRGGVHYWTAENSGPSARTLVFLHGLTADHTLFDGQARYFEKKYRLIIWDAPAHGKSRPYSDFTYPHAADDLKGILDENGIDTAVLIGQSMGGYIIQSFLLRYPERASAFVAIDSCPYGDYYSKSDKWWLRQVEWMSKLYPLSALKKSMAKQCTFTEHAYRNMLAMYTPYGKNELCHLMGIGYAGFLEDSRPMDIKCPTLLLAGEHDRTGKVLNYCRAWAKKNRLHPPHDTGCGAQRQRRQPGRSQSGNRDFFEGAHVSPCNEQRAGLCGVYLCASRFVGTLKAPSAETSRAWKTTGTKARRPEPDKMTERLEPGDKVIVYSLSRLGRSTKDLLALLEMLRESRCRRKHR